MDALSPNFHSLRLAGLWREEKESFGLARRLYRLLVVAIVFYFTFTLTAEIALKSSDIDHLTEALFFATTYLTLCFKIINFLARRDNLLEIIRDLNHPHCQPNGKEETTILAKHATTSTRLFTFLMGFAICDALVFFYTFASKVALGAPSLPYKTYQFYEVSSPRVAYPTACFQVVANVYSIVINISLDTMFAGLFMAITGQMELNARRLEKLSRGDVVRARDCVAHGLLVRGVTEKVESLVVGVAIPFFLLSMASICTSMFQASKYNFLSSDFAGICVFSLCILLQVFIYCWFGNQLMLKSREISNAVYKCDWISMDARERRLLFVLMICNKKGQRISCHGLCALNMKTFLWIIKTSYATVSLLHQVNTRA